MPPTQHLQVLRSQYQRRPHFVLVTMRGIAGPNAAQRCHRLTGSGSNPSPPVTSRRDAALAILIAGCPLSWIWAPVAPARALTCPGLNGYALQQCLKQARLAKQANEEQDSALSVEDERLRSRQYEQPGTLVTLPSGVQFREIEEGNGPEAAELGTCILDIQYTVYRLASGGYFKNSSGGTPVLLWSLGSGFEGRDDADEVYRFRLGDPGSLPAAATPAVVGMRAGGRRRILIPPRAGWVDDKIQPRPPSFGGQRRLAAHRDEPLLLEVQLLRVRRSEATGSPVDGGLQAGSAQPPRIYRLPATPSPFKDRLLPPPV